MRFYGSGGETSRVDAKSFELPGCVLSNTLAGTERSPAVRGGVVGEQRFCAPSPAACWGGKRGASRQSEFDGSGTCYIDGVRHEGRPRQDLSKAVEVVFAVWGGRCRAVEWTLPTGTNAT